MSLKKSLRKIKRITPEQYKAHLQKKDEETEKAWDEFKKLLPQKP